MKRLSNNDWQGPSILVMWYSDTGRQNPARYVRFPFMMKTQHSLGRSGQSRGFRIYSHQLYCCGYILYYFFIQGMNVLLGNACYYTRFSKDTVVFMWQCYIFILAETNLVCPRKCAVWDHLVNHLAFVLMSKGDRSTNAKHSSNTHFCTFV